MVTQYWLEAAAGIEDLRVSFKGKPRFHVEKAVLRKLLDWMKKNLKTDEYMDIVKVAKDVSAPILNLALAFQLLEQKGFLRLVFRGTNDKGEPVGDDFTSPPGDRTVVSGYRIVPLSS